jgi:hypothetical protein
MSRARKHLVTFPTWSREIEGWTRKQIKNWYFGPSEDHDDLMQEARILYWQLENIYPTVTDAPHLFALYRTAFKRRLIDKARKMKRRITDALPIAEVVELPESNMQNMGHLSMLLEELPSELKIILRALTTGRVRLKLDKPTKKLRHRENHNMRLKRKFALDMADPVGELKAYFANS